MNMKAVECPSTRLNLPKSLISIDYPVSVFFLFQFSSQQPLSFYESLILSPYLHC